MAPVVEGIGNTQKTHGAAAILGIGTANPPNVIHQDNYTDFYFRVTNSDHMNDLKNKFKRMCDKTTIKKRHMYVTEEFFKENPHLCNTKAFSLDARQEILSKEVPMLGKQAADNAIKEWGQSKSNITHLIFCTMSGVHAPGADYQLTKLLSLRPSVHRFMLYHQGCHGGATSLRLAKDLAENNCNARVLIVCSEIMSLVSFHGPTGMNFDTLIGQALFGDGASAAIVGANPIIHVEKPLFQLVWAGQTMLPGSERTIEANLKEIGVVIHLHKDVPNLISDNINNVLNEAFGPMDISDWNSIFWVTHPGGPAILDQVEVKGGLKKEKLDSSRYVLSEYGNMSSACLLFVLDEMRKRSAQEGKSTTGEGLDWGVLFGFGPGLTVETMVLHSMPLA